jgi:dTDP-4-dehydrorhamnose 3,5-epimerase-like enzyme
MVSSLDHIKLIDLPKHLDPRGNISIVEEETNIPFRIERCYWIYDVPGGQVRGGHAFRVQEEFIVALSGSFDVMIDDGTIQKNYHLNRSYYGLYIPSGLWRQMQNFSTNSVAMVLSSTHFQVEDYIRDYEEYKLYRLTNG